VLKTPQAPGDATVLKRVFRDNLVIFRRRSIDMIQCNNVRVYAQGIGAAARGDYQQTHRCMLVYTDFCLYVCLSVCLHCV